MAPEQGALKRKRTRPSNWWEADTSTLEQDERVVEQTATAANASQKEQLIKEAPAAGNRGKSAKSQEILKGKGTDNAEDELAVPPIKDRLSQSKQKRQNNASQYQHNTPEVKKSKPLSAQAPTIGGSGEQIVQKRRGRPPAGGKKQVLNGKTPRVPQEKRAEHLVTDNEASVKTTENRHGRRTRHSDAALAEQTVDSTSQVSRVKDSGRTQRGLNSKDEHNARSRKGKKQTRDGSHIASSIRSTNEDTSGRSRAPPKIDIDMASSKLTSSHLRVKKKSIVTQPSGTAPKSTKTPSAQPSQDKNSIASSKRRRKNQDTGSQPSKRRRTSKVIDSPESSNSQVDQEMSYQHLAELTRKVSRQTIDAQWGPLPPACVDSISEILDETQRPVIVHINDEGKQTQASTALQMVARRLIGKIKKGLPFPAGTRPHRQEDFVFERILDQNRSLEAQLSPALHANELLRSELSKELNWLEAEKGKLAELEANAKAEAVVRNEAGRRVHPILRSNNHVTESEGMTDDIGLTRGSYGEPTVLQLPIATSNELSPLITLLEGHVDSIDGNLKQVLGITKAVAKTRAILQTTLYDHLDTAQYEEVVLAVD